MTTLTDTQNAVMKDILAWYDDQDRQEYYLAGYAFTGKAAYVLRKKSVDHAQTIHSMIYRLREDPETGTLKFELDSQGPATDAELIVLDECSMVPEPMADDLRSFGTKLLVVGDPGQLPPVKGQGAFTAREPDAFLSEIHRQAIDSPIIRLATMARKGERIPVGDYGGGVKVVPYNADAAPYVYDAKTQPIVGLNRVRWVLTQRVRARLGFDSRLPQPGEPLLCCRNNHKTGMFNGQQGRLQAPLEDSLDGHGVNELVAHMEDHERAVETQAHPYLFEAHFTGSAKPPELPRHVKVDHFDWGYVLTCHKSQGSQWPRVTVVDDSAAFRADRDRWLYTAITRAESELTLIRKGGG